MLHFLPTFSNKVPLEVPRIDVLSSGLETKKNLCMRGDSDFSLNK